MWRQDRCAMLRGFRTVVAARLVLVLVLVLALAAPSVPMNFAFGYGRGTSEAIAGIFAGSRSPSTTPRPCRRASRPGSGATAVSCAQQRVPARSFSSPTGLASALGFSSQNREGVVAATREHLSASLKQHAADLEAAEKRQRQPGAHSIASVIEADTDKLKEDGTWDATLAASREFCERLDAVRAELTPAAAEAMLTAKIDSLKFKIELLGARGADPQLGDIARATGLQLLRMHSGLNWLVAIAVQAVSCFGHFAITRHRQAAREEERASKDAPRRPVSREGATRQPAHDSSASLEHRCPGAARTAGQGIREGHGPCSGRLRRRKSKVINQQKENADVP
jgi:hypothetical protein